MEDLKDEYGALTHLVTMRNTCARTRHYVTKQALMVTVNLILRWISTHDFVK